MKRKKERKKLYASDDAHKFDESFGVFTAIFHKVGHAWINFHLIVIENRYPLIKDMVIVQIWPDYQPFKSLTSLDYHSFIGYKWNVSQISSIIILDGSHFPLASFLLHAANRPTVMIFGILHTFQSVCPSHGQWPAPMGSWRV